MNESTFTSTQYELRQMRRLLYATLCVLFVVGVLWTDSFDALIGYMLVLVTCALPVILWVRLGAPGVPVLPATAVFYYLYYGVPITRANFGQVAAAPEDVLRAAATAAVFVIATTLTWWLITYERLRRPRAAAPEFVSGAQIRKLIFGGIIIGAVFQFGVMVNWWTLFGTFFSVIRAVALAVAAIACYLVGYSRGRGILRGQFGLFALCGVALLIALSWISLFLVGGMVYILAAILGYVLTSKRIPWKFFLPLVALMFVLHAGKGDMRGKYWTQGVAQIDVSPIEMPVLFVEWLGDGVNAIISGTVQQDLLDRASLLYRLIFVQQLTPSYIPYLSGESYALLGDYLVPRFLDPNKVASQAGTALLNIRYGVQTSAGTSTTTIGWGLVAEAYANDGYLGVLVAGLVFGVLTAIFTCWSAGAPPLALSTLMAVSALVTLTDTEADFGYLLVNLWQALVATFTFFVAVKLLARAPRSAARPRASPLDHPAE
jgi:hypothetical protein